MESWRSPTSLHMMNGLMVDTAGSVYLYDLLEPRDPSEPDRQRRSGYVRFTADAPDRRDTIPLPDIGSETPPLMASAKSGQGSMTTMRTVPFAAGTFRILAPAGYFVTARGDRYAVTLHRPEGPLRIERDVPPTPVDHDERANEEERVVVMLRNVDPSWRWTGPAIPEVKPTIKSLEIGADGRIWVRRSMPGERIPDAGIEERGAGGQGGPRATPPRRWREPTTYDVFTPEGEYLGFIPIPPRTTLMHRSGNGAWGVVRDSLDVPYVTRFRIEWGVGRGGGRV